jgi:hypothetical protein
VSDRRLSWLCFAATALFYLSFHSYFYNFDGVACAVAVELSDFKHLVHGNHLAYGVVGWAFWSLWRLLGYRGPALLALQTLDSLLGAGAVAVFYSALRRARVDRAVAVSCAAGLAVSHGFWLWSLEAQVYPLGLFFIAWALREALSDRPRPALLGFFHGAAILGHVGHLMFAPAALYALKKRSPDFKKAFARYVCAGAATVLPAYLLAGLLAVRPRSGADLRLWLLGSAALNHERSFAWHGSLGLVNVKEWATMTLRLFADLLWAPESFRWAAVLLALAALAFAAYGARRALKGPRRYEAALCGLWLAAYAALYLSWEPHTMVYRLSDLLPLWLLAALAAPASPWPAAALACGLGVFNAVFGVGPKTVPQANDDYQEAVWLSQTLPDDATVVVTAQGQVYVPYFAHRRPLNLYYWELRLPELAAELDARLARGERVFVTSRTLAQQGREARRFFEIYGLSPVTARGDDALYQVAGKKGKPSGSTMNRLKTAPAERNGPNGIGSERLARPRSIKPRP